MALFVKQNDNRSELQQRLATELQERAKLKNPQPGMPDGVDDSQFIKNTQGTSKLAWVWILVIILFVGAMIGLVIGTAR